MIVYPVFDTINRIHGTSEINETTRRSPFRATAVENGAAKIRAVEFHGVRTRTRLE